MVATRLPVGSIPGEGDRADAAHAAFAELFPAAVRVSDGLDAALLNWGPCCIRWRSRTATSNGLDDLDQARERARHGF